MNNETNNKIPLFSSIITGLFIILVVVVVSKPKPAENGTLWHSARGQGGVQDVKGLSITWGDLGSKMVASGVIDKEKLESLYAQRGGLSESDKKIIDGSSNENIVIDSENAGLMLNMLWGLGLGNKNPVLESGPMVESEGKEGAGRFASTGGWTLSSGDPMDHYSMHSFIVLTKDQQLLVEKVSKGIFRPCCNNSTYFPDCNHGMAMLGFLELMASQGVPEADMYKSALALNRLWFPGQYEVIVNYLESRGEDINTIDPKKVVSAEYFSAQGYKNILASTQPTKQEGGGGCSV